MVKKLQSRGLVFAIIATTILLSTIRIESCTGTGILQQNGTKKCIACIGQLISDLEGFNGTLTNLAREGAITAQQAQAPNLFDQLMYRSAYLVKACNCKHNCKYFSFFQKGAGSFEAFAKRDDLLKAYNTVYWYAQCQKNLAGLITGLKKLTYMDDAKRIEFIAQDIEQCKKVVLNPDLKQELARNRYCIESTIKKLNELKREEFKE